MSSRQFGLICVFLCHLTHQPCPGHPEILIDDSWIRTDFIWKGFCLESLVRGKKIINIFQKIVSLKKLQFYKPGKKQARKVFMQLKKLSQGLKLSGDLNSPTLKCQDTMSVCEGEKRNNASRKYEI